MVGGRYGDVRSCSQQLRRVILCEWERCPLTNSKDSEHNFYVLLEWLYRAQARFVQCNFRYTFCIVRRLSKGKKKLLILKECVCWTKVVLFLDKQLAAFRVDLLSKRSRCVVEGCNTRRVAEDQIVSLSTLTKSNVYNWHYKG